MSLAPGTRLGPYRITAPLGAGGMGEVYRAEDERLGREVAVKVLPSKIAGDPDRLRRFEQEARAASALNHPGILTVHDFGRDGDVAYLVTELLEGESLRERLKRGPLPRHEAIAIGGEIARALSAAHAKGVVHRDLKPENLFLMTDGRVKILDFGLALRQTPSPAEENPSGEETLQRLTQAGVVVGTIGYMAPEQARGLTVDARADIFALGCVVLEMITGRAPFQRGTSLDTLSAILNEDPVSGPVSAGTLGSEAGRVLRHCLEKEPSRRFQSAGDAAFALESLASPPADGISGAATSGKGRRWIMAALAAAALLAVSAIAWWSLRERAAIPSGEPGDVRSIAVLPFATARADASLEYLGDGIAEAVINRLSPLEGLRVLARTTVFRFKGDDVDPLKVGRDLGVSTVVAGRVEEMNGRLLIGVELVDVASGSQLWGDRFNRPASDLFEIEEDVARQIGKRLAVRLGKADRERIGSRPTESERAYRLYLQGRHLWYQRTRESVTRSIELFRTAVELDPGFALAWNGLGDAYTVGWAGYHGLPIEEAYSRGEAAVRRALELDDRLAEAHTSLGFLLFERQWDWAGAERELRRALELDPGSAYAHQAYGEYLYCMGRFDESLSELESALELDPLSEIVSSVIGWSYLARRDVDGAIAQFDSVLRREPGFVDAQGGLTLATFTAGSSEPERGHSLIDMARASGQPAEVVASLRDTYDRDGITALWNALLDLQTHATDQGWIFSPQFVMWTYANLGETSKALDIAERMHAERSPALSYAKTGALFDPLRAEPRFQRILADMDFPETPAAH